MTSPIHDIGIVANPNARYKRKVRRSITPHEEIRRRFGFGVVGLATAAGFSHTYVSLVEAGRLKPSARYRKAVAKVLNVPEELLFDPPAGSGGDRNGKGRFHESERAAPATRRPHTRGAKNSKRNGATR